MTSHLRSYLKLFALLTAVALGERLIFAVSVDGAASGLSWAQIAEAFIWGLRFDAALGALLAFVCHLAAYAAARALRTGFTTTLRRTGYVAVVLLVTLHGADLIYFMDAGRHLGYELRDAYGSGTELALTAVGTYSGPLIFQLTFLTALLAITSRLFRDGTAAASPKLLVLMPEANLAGALLVTVFVARGGVQSIPLEPIQAHELADSKQATLALNGAYNALHSSLTPYSIQPVIETAPTAEDRGRLQAMYARTDVPAPAHSPRKMNVVLVFLESWSAGLMSAYGYEKPSTPVFEQLRSRGLTTRAMFAGGRRTTEGMYATLCSAQNPLGQTVARTQLQQNRFHCLPHILREQGYATAFFQGSSAGTSGTGPFAQLLGFEDSYGKSDIGFENLRFSPNGWGIQDPDLYDFALEKMRSSTQPFLFGINTNTTHDKSLPDGVVPRFAGEDRNTGYLNTLHFADRALGEFIQKVEASPELGPTLFVLVADHTGPAPISLYYQFLVPFAIVGPDIAPQQVEAAASQRDIAPTVLDILGIDQPPWFSGLSLLAPVPGGSRFADFYGSGQIGWTEGDALHMIPLRGDRADRCFNYAQDPLMRHPVPCGSAGEARRQRALAFTRISQHLLFDDRVLEFGQFRNRAQD